MLADDEDRIDGQPVAAAAQGLGDGRIDRKAELFGPLAAQVVVGLLVDIDRDDFKFRLVPFTFERKAHEEAFAHVPGVRMVAPFGGHDGHLLAAAAPRLV